MKRLALLALLLAGCETTWHPMGDGWCTRGLLIDKPQHRVSRFLRTRSSCWQLATCRTWGEQQLQPSAAKAYDDCMRGAGLRKCEEVKP